MTEKTVVIVDDIAASRASLVSLYKEIGWKVVAEASNGLEAIEAVIKHKPTLISLDVVMPKMDGVEAYQRMLAQKLVPSSKVVFITYLAKEPLALKAICEKISPDLFLAKFPSSDDLTSKIAQILGLKDPSVHTVKEAKPEQSTKEWLDDLSAKMYDSAS